MAGRKGNFAEWLDVTLSNKRMPSKELAELVNVHESAVSRWRNGNGTPTLDTVPYLAQALGVDALRLALTTGRLPAQMADGIRPLEVPSPTARRESVKHQISRIKGLTEKERRALLIKYEELSEDDEQ